jgi:hypothetical protein
MLRTRIFQLWDEKYHGDSKMLRLAQAMGVSLSQVYRVRQGKRRTNERFIIGAMRAFPGYKLDDLFYITQEGRTDDHR